MTYSCACFSRGAATLEEAQEAKLELVCTKLGLREGERVLDVGCGWGSFALHAASRHGVRVLGITLSEPQAELGPRSGRAEAGPGGPGRDPRRRLPRAGRRAVRRDREHRDGRARRARSGSICTPASWPGLLGPGGRLLNHGIAKLQDLETPDEGAFSERFVFPDGVPLPLSRIAAGARARGLRRRRTSRGFADDYAETLAPLDRALRVALRATRSARGRRARAGLAAVPARRPPGRS